MNAMLRGRVLNEAFKHFQRLPDWPIAKTREASHLAEKGNAAKAKLSAGITAQAGGTRAGR